MTLSDLAALAASKVPGFERPDGLRCATCDAQGGYFDDSPAALLMAVVLHRCKTQKPLLGRGHGIFCLPVDAAPDTRESPESIARAALVALLRAHGVEVPNAE